MQNWMAGRGGLLPRLCFHRSLGMTLTLRSGDTTSPAASRPSHLSGAPAAASLRAACQARLFSQHLQPLSKQLL